MKILLYDGSFEGFMSAVFHVYQHKLNDVMIRKNTTGVMGLFGETIEVMTNIEQSDRVWKSLQTKTSCESAKKFYCSFLSEIEAEEDNMLHYLRYIFASTQDVSEDYSHPAVLRVSKVAKMVGREKHRMEAFVRFQLVEDNTFYAIIEPDFNVLPLISKHFEQRYADQKWLIFDQKRHYGLLYDLNRVEIIEYNTPPQSKALLEPNSVEKSYQNLWKVYFKNTNIKERRNMKIHLQHVPVRYWKYLSEKSPL